MSFGHDLGLRPITLKNKLLYFNKEITLFKILIDNAFYFTLFPSTEIEPVEASKNLYSLRHAEAIVD